MLKSADNQKLPPEILLQHLAVLGKTGSGKTSTAKLAIEQVVAEGGRVCVLDPIKSDWWGLTSSATGKRDGLPFHILGGPHGHVPLHSDAGKAIAGVVASGALPLSIIDMADFEPGGQAKFFVDFAPVLLRKMRGVVYLVIEEAHLFAPKERSGIGAENLSIHWAKTMATAGRSKGVRLVLVTQRTQALHNALLGSCDTLIAHRLTAPADQDPVVKWLKANTSKEVLNQVAASLSSLKTGEGWICSGEAKLFELVQFPRISTYDNTATPTGEGDTQDIKTAAVDPEKLRAIIGDAIDKAKADDPRELRKQIADLQRQLSSTKITTTAERQAASTPRVIEKPVITDAQLEKVARAIATADVAMQRLADNLQKPLASVREHLAALTKAFTSVRQPQLPMPAPRTMAFKSSTPHEPITPSQNNNNDHHAGAELPQLQRAAERKILQALAPYPGGRTIRQVAILAGYAMSGGGFRNAVGRLRSEALIENGGAGIRITDLGLQVLGPYDPLPTGRALVDHWLGQLDRKAEREILQVLVDVYPNSLTADDIAGRTATGYEANGGGFRNALGKLRTLELVQGRGELKASDEFFAEA